MKAIVRSQCKHRGTGKGFKDVCLGFVCDGNGDFENDHGEDLQGNHCRRGRMKIQVFSYHEKKSSEE